MRKPQLSKLNWLLRPSKKLREINGESLRVLGMRQS